MQPDEERRAPQKVSANEIDPLPARRRPTLIAISVLGLAFFLLGLGVLGYAHSFGHQIDQRSVQRDQQHSQTEARLNAQQKRLDTQQKQISQLQLLLAKSQATEHTALCIVAASSHPSDASGQKLVRDFQKRLGCTVNH